MKIVRVVIQYPQSWLPLRFSMEDRNVTEKNRYCYLKFLFLEIWFCIRNKEVKIFYDLLPEFYDEPFDVNDHDVNDNTLKNESSN